VARGAGEGDMLSGEGELRLGVVEGPPLESRLLVARAAVLAREDPRVRVLVAVGAPGEFQVDLRRGLDVARGAGERRVPPTRAYPVFAWSNFIGRTAAPACAPAAAAAATAVPFAATAPAGAVALKVVVVWQVPQVPSGFAWDPCGSRCRP